MRTQKSMRMSVTFLLATISSAAMSQTPEPASDATSVKGKFEPRRCISPLAIAPPFNDTPEAKEQSRVAATAIAGEAVCKTSAVAPEISELQHGPEKPVDPAEQGQSVAEPPPDAETP